MANFTFKKSETVMMKVVGLLDSDKMTILVDGEDKNIQTLLASFDGELTELIVKVKSNEMLDEPAIED